MRYVIAYPLFDGESRRWQLDAGAVVRTLGRLAPSLKGMEGQQYQIT